jgi:GDPmannose 4,6-dehydratase
VRKKCLITGITGQSGSYLAEFLLEKNYEVHGMIRRSSSFNTDRIENIYDKIHLHYGDMTDSLSIDNIIQNVKPNYIYNLAAQSHVATSFYLPEYTAQTDGIGTLRILEAMKKHTPKARFYQASTSELFGRVLETPQNEKTPFNPVSPYAIAKQYAFNMVQNYRNSYGLFASNGILFNHESNRRGETFVTKKITKGLVKWLKTGIPIRLGNLNSQRDWGYAPEYVEAMWMILQHDSPDDFVIATGECHSNKEFIEEACKYINVDILWKGKGLFEKGIDKKTNKTVIITDSIYFRPCEVDVLLGDPSKAKNVLGWESKVKFKELVKIMMEHDLANS